MASGPEASEPQGCYDKEELSSPRVPAGRGQSKKADLGQVLGHPGSYGPNSDVAAAAAKSLQSFLALHDPIDGSPPGSSIHGIFQARVLEWGAIAFSELRCCCDPIIQWYRGIAL